MMKRIIIIIIIVIIIIIIAVNQCRNIVSVRCRKEFLVIVETRPRLRVPPSAHYPPRPCPC